MKQTNGKVSFYWVLPLWIAGFAITGVQAVPIMMNLQGDVSVAGAPFDGQGLFRFALTDESGSVYYWSNDDNSEPIGIPATDISLTVSDGIFDVMLGNTDIMTSIPADVFEHDDLYIRIWFDNGELGLQQLIPDRKIVSVVYAFNTEKAHQTELLNGHEVSELEESDEIDADITAHASNPSAHHIKTTSFSEMVDTPVPSQIDCDISIQNDLISAPSGDGNVGIGVQNPIQGKLTVDSLAELPELYIANPMNAGSTSGAVNIGGGLFFDSDDISSANNLFINYDNSVNTVINNWGNRVGIGTVSPSSKLTVNGDIDISGRRLHIGTDGNVGIGTLSPQNTLTVVDSFEVKPPGLNLPDQIQPEYDNQISFDTIFQSFQPQITGDLVNISLHTRSSHAGTADTGRFKIYEGDGIYGVLLMDRVIFLLDPLDWYDFAVVPPVAMEKGNTYTFALEPDNPNQPWISIASANVYPHGSANLLGYDYAFKTFMNEKDPVSLCVSENGYTGINTISPNGRLHICDTTDIHHGTNFNDQKAPLIVGDTAAYQYSTMMDGNQIDRADSSDALYINGNSTAGITLAYGGGNVGVNVLNPTYDLQVDGDIYYTHDLMHHSAILPTATIQKIHDAGEIIKQLCPVSFESKGEKPNQREIGLIAQDVELLLPEIVSADPNGYLSIAYEKLTPVIIEAIKELREQNRLLRKELKDLQALRDVIVTKGGAK